MTEFLIAVTAASQIYRSRANTIVLTAGQCTLLVVVSRPTVQKITTALKTLYDMLEVCALRSRADAASLPHIRSEPPSRRRRDGTTTPITFSV